MNDHLDKSESQPASPPKSEPLRVSLGNMADAIERPQDFHDWLEHYRDELAELQALMRRGANDHEIVLTPRLLRKFAAKLADNKLVPSLAGAKNMHFSEYVELGKTIDFNWVAGVVDAEREEAKREADEQKRKAEGLSAAWLLHVDTERAKLRTATFNAEPEPAPNAGNGVAEVAEGATSRKPKIEDRMKAELASNLQEVKGWTAQQWANRLGCGKTTIIDTDTWKSLALLRQQMKAENRADRNVKRPTKTHK